ncbi:MAG: hypothetical protein JW384_02688 [Nitrosomonadaceae bacterium]|nr:hypothetical protein [Nitrosomonadaceae bacterium]
MRDAAIEKTLNFLDMWIDNMAKQRGHSSLRNK